LNLVQPAADDFNYIANFDNPGLHPTNVSGDTNDEFEDDMEKPKKRRKKQKPKTDHDLYITGSFCLEFDENHFSHDSPRTKSQKQLSEESKHVVSEVSKSKDPSYL